MAFVSQFFGGNFDVQWRNRDSRPGTCPRRSLTLQTPESPPMRVVKSEARDEETSPGISSEETPWTPGKTRAPRPVRGGGRKLRGNVRTQGKNYRQNQTIPSPPGLRVISGSARGRRIASPNVYLRPMMGKVREALFSMLETFDALRDDASVLDLYAGSGSIGIEALSRGLDRAVFVDSARDCVDVIESNLERCSFASRGQAVCAKVEDFMSRGGMYNDGRHFDLITITPPYEEVDYAELMKAIATSTCVGEGTFVVVEYPVELGSVPPAIENRLIGIRNRRYGRTVLALYACQPDVDIDRRPEEFCW